MNTCRTILIAALLLYAVSPALSQQFTNGGFDNGTLSGWTITPTPNGHTLVQTVSIFDIDGPGPLGSSPAAVFQVGQVTSIFNDQEGIELTQTLTLTAGLQYTLSCNWAATKNSTVANAEGGVFTLFVGTVDLAQQSAGGVDINNPRYGLLTGTFTPSSTAGFRAGVRITRPYTVDATTGVTQYIDNVSINSPGCPIIITQPQSITTCSNYSAPFSVTASGAPLLSYQWQIQTSPGVWQGLGNDPFPLPCGGGAFAYATPINSPDVHIGVHPCAGVNAYQIRSVVSNGCGSATSNEATLTLVPAGTGDGNHSGVTDGEDIPGFVAAAIAAGPANASTCAYDMNLDGSVNGSDVLPFISRLLN